MSGESNRIAPEIMAWLSFSALSTLLAVGLAVHHAGWAPAINPIQTAMVQTEGTNRTRKSPIPGSPISHKTQAIEAQGRVIALGTVFKPQVSPSHIDNLENALDLHTVHQVNSPRRDSGKAVSLSIFAFVSRSPPA